jgi:predicted ferric reductase
MLSQILIIAVVCLTATKIFTDLYKRYVSKKYTGIIALIISLICAFAFNLGLIQSLGELMGVPFILGWLAHIVDLVFTGVIYTKGANAINDIIKQIQPVKEEVIKQ